MKKTIAFVSALAIVFCCSFPAFATTPTGRRREASYDYGDVSLHVSVDAGASVTYNNDVCHYDHRFTVTLTNKTNTFQVADQNILGFKLYTGRKDYFDNTFVGSSGTTQTNASWGAEVTSYSDNMTVPDIKFYTSASSGWEGSVYIKFNDSDLLVLNPNETRTYNFTIDFIASQTVSAMPINGNYVYGYFTYLSNSSISIFNKPNTFTSNTIDQFLENDSFPNSAIAWLMASYDQGIVDQQKYDQILSVLIPSLNNTNLYGSDNGIIYASSLDSGFITFQNNNTLQYTDYVYAYNPYVVDRNSNIYSIYENNIYGSDFSVWCVPVYRYVTLKNITSNTYVIPSYFDFVNGFSSFTSNGRFVGTDYEFPFVNGLNVVYYNPNTGNISLSSNNVIDNKYIIANGDNLSILVRQNYYFVCDRYDNDVDNGDFIFKLTGNSKFTPSHTITVWNVFNQSLFASWAKNFADLRDRIQSILDSYNANQQGAEDVTDSAESSSSTIDNQHQTESNYFSDSQSAIQDTGIQNFQFTPQESAGLNGLKDDFTAVWVSCGTLSRVWITSLTIGLALAIIRHRRMFEK